MKKKIIIVAILVIALVGYFGYKLYIINSYKTEVKIEDIYKAQGETIIVNTNSNIVSNTKEGKMSFIIPKNFIENNSLYYFGLKNAGQDNQEFKAAINYGKATNKYTTLIQSGIEGKISASDVKSIFSKYNIKNEIDLQKFGLKIKNSKNNILSSASRIKMEYIITNTMPISQETRFIDGDIKGYLLLIGNGSKGGLYSASIQYKNDIYYFWFANGTQEYFNIENITEFLNNVQFK